MAKDLSDLTTSAVGVAVFRLKCGDEVKEHFHRIFNPQLVELAKLGDALAWRLVKEVCLANHGVQGELVEIWWQLYLVPGEKSNFTLFIPQEDVKHRTPHLPDDLFIES